MSMKQINSHKIKIESWGEGVLRVIIQDSNTRPSPSFLLGKGKTLKPLVNANEERIYESGGSRLVFRKNQGWQWWYKNRILLEQADEFYPSFKGPRAIVPPLEIDKKSAGISFRLHPDEPVFGGGESFGYLNKRRLRIFMRITDPCGLTTTPYSYKHIPLFWSPRGWGVFACTNYPVIADIGATSYTSFYMEFQEPCIDLFLIPGKPGDIIRQYWNLTGTPPLPPQWALGVWWSRCMYKNAREVKEVIQGLKRCGIRGSVISLDPLWLKNRSAWESDACDFEWNEDAFGKQEDFSSWLEKEGYKLCLWMNPYLWLKGESFDKLKSCLIRDKQGNIVRVEPPLCGKGIVERMEQLGAWDFTDPKAWKKRTQLIQKLVKQGAACFKVDYGEGVPPDDLHNVYAFLYVKNTWEAIAGILGEKEAFIWARPGWSGCQRYPGCWAGDSQSTFAAMASTLAGCLSLSASGVSWWSHDIGGFHHYTGASPSPELYIRWAEWGLISPLSRFHGTTPREPWHFGKKAVCAVRNLVNLRYNLITYICKSHKKLVPRGLPLARPLVMDYPHDPSTWDLATEYLFGDSLIIAPVLEKGAKKRNVYVPEGDWIQLEKTGDLLLKGPKWVECRSALGYPVILQKRGSVSKINL